MSHNAKYKRAGVLPYFINEDNIVFFMFMKPSDENYGGPDFQVAKGLIDPGETSFQAAIREGYEELGLLEDNILTITDMGTFLSSIKIYLAEIKDINRFDECTYETCETAWLTLPLYSKIGRKLHLPIVNKAYYIIQEKILENSDLIL